MVEVLCKKRKVPQTPKGWMLLENLMGKTRVGEARNDKEIARPQKGFDVVNKVGRLTRVASRTRSKACGYTNWLWLELSRLPGRERQNDIVMLALIESQKSDQPAPLKRPMGRPEAV
jgi:hypothetical protein